MPVFLARPVEACGGIGSRQKKEDALNSSAMTKPEEKVLSLPAEKAPTKAETS